MHKDFGISFDGKHSFRDYGLILNDKIIGSPSVKTYEIDVPYRDGKIDVTGKTNGHVCYDNRSLRFTFTCLKPLSEWPRIYSELLNTFHGKRMQVICDDDIAFYYSARLNVNQWESDKTIGKIVIEGDAEPYKYDVSSSAVDWEWDVFDFEEGIINEMNQLIVSGTRTITLICRQKQMFPEFTCSAAMMVTFEGETYNLKAGTQKIFDMFLTEGNNELTFTGNGAVTIDYIGGSL